MEMNETSKQILENNVKKLTFAELFSMVKEKLEQKNEKAALAGRTAFEFHVSDLEGVFYAEVNDGRIDVEPYDYHDRNGVFTASASTYAALCDGSLAPVTAFAAGRLKVEQDVDLVKTLETLFTDSL